MHQGVPDVQVVAEPVPDSVGVHLPAFSRVPPCGAGRGEGGVGVGVGGRWQGGVEWQAEVRHPGEQGGLEEGVAGEGVGVVDELEEAEGVVEREREEAGGGGEEEEAAGGEGVGEEAGGDELGVDLKQVARGAAPREVRVQEGHRQHGRRRRRGGESRATSCSFELRTR